MRILVLSTWFPYPLSQGSKIRAYYLLRALAVRHQVALISFADTAIQPAWLEHMSQWCSRLDIVQYNPFKVSTIKRCLGWFSRKPSAVVASYSSEMARQVRQVAADWKPECLIALTFVTAPYALAVPGVHKIVDIDNLMTPMLHEAYRRSERPLQRYRNWLARAKFRNYEKWLYHQFDLCLLVSNQDRVRAADLIQLAANRTGVVSNGVDTSCNQVTTDDPEPNTVVFTGALTYSANYDAMEYFLREIWTLVLAEVPEAHLRITGSTNGVPIERFPSISHVTFTGYLENIGPTVSNSCVCVVPLRVGGGTRLKILEAMALGTPVVSTSKGAEGLDVEAGTQLLIADTPIEFAASVVRLLREPQLRRSLTTQAAHLVKEKYDWSIIGQNLCKLVENV